MKQKILSWVYLGMAVIFAIVANISSDLEMVIAFGAFGLFCVLMSELKDIHAELEAREK